MKQARALLPKLRRLAHDVRLAYEQRQTTPTDARWLCALGDALEQFRASGEASLSGGTDPRDAARVRKSQDRKVTA